MTAANRPPVGLKCISVLLSLFGILNGQELLQREQSTQCDCEFHYSRFYGWTGCININTTEQVKCAKDYIANKIHDFRHVDIRGSDLDLFPYDFFGQNNVTEIIFRNCTMSEVPTRLLGPLLPTLTLIFLESSHVASGHISAGVLGTCLELRHLLIKAGGIKTISTGAFEGLLNLQELDLSDNVLESFEGFRGIGNLEILDLSGNNISFIDKNAFQGLDNLNRILLHNNKLVTLEEGLLDPFKKKMDLLVFLDGNPFHCNCSLQWLQDWLRRKTNKYQYTRRSDLEPRCTGPQNGTIRALHFCKHTTSISIQNHAPAPPISTAECSLRENNSWIFCINVTEFRQVNRAREFMSRVFQDSVSLSFDETDVDYLPDLFFAPFNTTELQFSNSRMAEMPTLLVNPICSSLKYLRFSDCDVKSRTIPAGAFAKCTKLQRLTIQHSGIRTVSPTAFEGLLDLTDLYLGRNEIDSILGFPSLPNLETLDLADNGISFIDKNAFQGLVRLTSLFLNDNQLVTLEEGVFHPFINNKKIQLDLYGNPFHCNCSLKWFQDWLRKRPTDQYPYSTGPACDGQMQGIMIYVNFCTTPPSPANGTAPEMHKSIWLEIGLLLEKLLNIINHFEF